MWLYLGVVVATLGGLGMYNKRRKVRCHSKANLTGKTVIVTGANSGIGYETALDMARRDARVILACRRLQEADRACSAIQSETGNQNVLVKHLDLSSLKSVRDFAQDVMKTEKDLHILVNNAAIVQAPWMKKSEDGLHYLMQTNHFGPFLLTCLLLDKLKQSAPSRIVNLSSLAYKMGTIDFDNLNFEKGEPRTGTYGASKLANILFTRELSRQLEGTGVTANCLHPGAINSGLFRPLPVLVRWGIHLFGYFFFLSPEEGAQTSIHCAVSEEMDTVTGQYLSNCKIGKLPKYAEDDTAAKKLWDVSKKLTGLST